MNAELDKVDSWLRGRSESPKSYSDLSKDGEGNPLINDGTVEAYDYDSVTESFFAPGVKPCCCSCDALLLKEHLYLIEFKRSGRGVDFFDHHLGIFSNNKKNQAWRVFGSVESKLSESLYMLEKQILQPLDVDERRFEKHAVIVYDCNKDAPEGLAASRASSSGQPQTASMHQRFEGRDVEGNPVFFHKVQTIPDSLFTEKIRGLI
jgi:hypothetical protein